MTLRTNVKEGDESEKAKYENGELSGFAVQAPDGGWGWFIVFGSFAVHMIMDGITYAFGVFTADLLEHFDTTREVIGWLNSILVGITLGSGPIASILSKKYGYRMITMIGGVLGSIGIGAPYFFDHLSFLIISISIISGFGFGLTYLPSICILGSYFEKKRALAIGLAVCGSGVGTFVFGPLIDILIIKYSWRGSLLMLSGVILNCCVAGALYRPLVHAEPLLVLKGSSPISDDIEDQILRQSHHQKKSKNSDKNFGDEIILITSNGMNLQESEYTNEPNMIIAMKKLSTCRQEIVVNSNENSPVKVALPASCDLQTKSSRYLILHECCTAVVKLFSPHLLTNRVFMLFAVSNFLTSIGFNAPFLFAADRAILMGIPRSRASLLVSSMGVGNTLGRIIFGALATRGSKPFHLHLYNLSLALCGAVTTFSFLARNYTSMIFYTAAFGLLSGSYVTLTSVVLIDLLGLETLNESFGLTLLFMGIGVLIGPPFAGWIYDKTNSYDVSFGVCGICIFISGVMLYSIFFLKKIKR